MDERSLDAGELARVHGAPAGVERRLDDAGAEVAHAFDLRSVKKSCVHIVHPDARRLIPFDTYNLFYRDALEETVLAPLRERAERSQAVV